MATTQEVRRNIGVRDLLEAGLHFGHQTKRWNPKMKRYIFDKRNGIHIIDLAKSLATLQDALEFLHDTVAAGKSVLFVGTKKQAQQVIKETAESCEQHYVTTRWLGGTLTNRATIKRSVQRLRELEGLEKEDTFAGMHKKEASRMRRELEKLRRNLSGVARMSDLPGALFVVDINREGIAVAEANKLDIPVVAIVDTNCDPDPIDYVIPGNDDAIRAVRLIVGLVAETVRDADSEYRRAAAEQARRREEEKAAAEARREAKAKQAMQARAQTVEQSKGEEAAVEAKSDTPAEKTEAKPARKRAPKKKAAPKAKAEPKPKAEPKAKAETEPEAAPKPEAAPEEAAAEKAEQEEKTS